MTAEARVKSELFSRCHAALSGNAAGAISLFVPGRIEFLGKHTDYAGGRSLVCAIERGICFVARPRRDRQITLHDVVSHQSVSFEFSPALEIPSGSWKTYPITTARRLARNFPALRTGADIAFGSDLPRAAGLSSSSALVTGCYVILSRLNQLDNSGLSTPE
ncbi:MAG TPA: galactokinase family protein, partial [Gemmatimonadales bacterium]|nr:galactokinase family protein [Gemmatimonadales bacterium]